VGKSKEGLYSSVPAMFRTAVQSMFISRHCHCLPYDSDEQGDDKNRREIRQPFPLSRVQLSKSNEGNNIVTNARYRVLIAEDFT